MMTRSVVIGSRGSDLALWQANSVKDRLAELFPERTFELKIINTTGDEIVDVALSKIGDKGLFTRQIETELLDGSIDLAVHSLKDLQTAQPQGLVIGAVCERESPNDAFISKTGGMLEELPEGAKVATGSLRRKSQLLNYRPDLRIEEIRGNVPTRLKKFDASDLDGIILAHAGLRRLGFESRISQLIPFDVMIPAVGQGAVAVEIRCDDRNVADLVSRLEHRETRVCTSAERSLLRRLEGGCQVPIGAHATMDGDKLELSGVVGGLDGKICYRERLSGPADDAEGLGIRLAETLIERGARELLERARDDAEKAQRAVL